jgi:plastocyanin
MSGHDTAARLAVLAMATQIGVIPSWLHAAGAQGSRGAVVQGTVTVTGARTSADVVVSLHAPDLVVTPPTQPMEIDQKALQFRPHVLAVVRGTTVRFLNNDAEDHNVYSPEGGYNLGTWAPGLTRDQTFDTVGVYTQLCRIHPDMEAFVVVLDTPHFAVTDAAGRYVIRGVRPGDYTLRTWGKRLKTHEQPVTVAGGRSLVIDLALSR